MLLNLIVVERAHVPDMHMRIDQARNKKPAVSIDLLCMCSCNKISSDLFNPSVTNDHNSVREGRRALGRDHGHIFDNCSVVYDLRFGDVRTGERIENRSNQWKKPDERTHPHIGNGMRGIRRLDSACR